MSANNGGGPCGACKFLRRKCVKGCIFAPYFDSDQGMAQFAAVHKVYGASNASKMLQRIPAHERVDAAVALCYEALARVRDPVYGCVAHVLTLQQQVVNLQAELAYNQARLPTLHRHPLMPPTSLHSSPEIARSELASSSNMSVQFDPLQQQQQTSSQLTSFPCPFDQEGQNKELQVLAKEFVSRYLPGVRFRPSTSG
ncbi:LOB domain-containing protein 19 [Hibiscus syriacus]|uniref:LOB domain-containing protein 19 n=1 Tax=Hibiscus syriacus TaxID=106335 RepID=A0A6A3C296_HIBSY|nr:LOB domain-containing protein 19-like [Hibiscus syriacus]KAE8721282.1 LOB domain-containing protein 19 [Hibiscus syriacus]